MSVTDLPAVNATLNSLATVLLVSGFICIKAKRAKAHIVCMSCALLVSGVFLACYLYYHYQVGHVKFAGEGPVRTFYFALLASHILLAVVNLPMIIMTVVPALRLRFDRHLRMARWTLPVWLYVSVTGVIVYFMCYHWYGPPLR
jgi:putative membrane protein